MAPNSVAVNEWGLMGLVMTLVLAVTINPDRGSPHRWIYWLGIPLVLGVVEAALSSRVSDGVALGVMGLALLVVAYGVRRARARWRKRDDQISTATAESEHPETTEPAPPRALLPWWGQLLIAAAGLALLVGTQREQAAVAELLPPPDGWFASGQTVPVDLTDGELKTVYWDFQNAVRRVRATAQCRARDRESGAEILLTPIGGDLRVDNRKALVTITPWRTGTADLTCYASGARTSQFGVGKQIPGPGLFNGVEAATKGAGLVLVGLAFLAPLSIVLALCPLEPTVRAWIFQFWAPLMFAAVLAIGTNSLWSGLFLGMIWYGFLGVRRLRAARSDGRERPE